MKIKTFLKMDWRAFGVELRNFGGWKGLALLCWTEGDPFLRNESGGPYYEEIIYRDDFCDSHNQSWA